jgi:cell division protein FtsQ
MLTLLEKFPLIRQKLTSLTRVRDRRWDLIILGNVHVKLPDENIEKALATLSLLIEQKKVVSGEVSCIDLRIKDKIIMRVTQIAAIGIKMKGRET